jgi:hypothetical protein
MPVKGDGLRASNFGVVTIFDYQANVSTVAQQCLAGTVVSMADEGNSPASCFAVI